MRRHRALNVGLAPILAVALSGCGSASQTPVVSGGLTSPPAASRTTSASEAVPPFADVLSYRVDPLGRLVEPGPAPIGKPEVAWSVSIGTTHWSPIMVGGLLVVGTKAGDIIALDGRTGAEAWRFHAADAMSTDSLNEAAAAGDGLVFVSDNSTVYALDAITGKQHWTTTVPTRGSRPIPVDGVIYVGTVGGAVGLDEATGKIVMTWAGPPGIPTTAGAVSDGVAYVSSRGDGRLYAVDVRSPQGSLRWNLQTISLAVGSSEVVGDSVYVATNQGGATQAVGEAYAIDRATGSIRWRYPSPSGRQLVPGPVRDGVVYLSSEVDGIYAMRDDGTSVTKVWNTATPPTFFPLSMVGDTLFESRNDGSIGAYAVADGHLIWETAPTGDSNGGPPLVSGGMIFGVGDGGTVTAYADPGLIALLPTAAPQPTPAPTPSTAPAPDPFTVIRSFSWAATKLSIPLGMDVGPDGLLYVLDTKPSVTVIDPADGRIVHGWGSQGAGDGQFDLAVAPGDDNPGVGDIAVAPDGNILVADGNNARVEVFRPDGHYVTRFGSFGVGDGRFGSVSEIVIGADGGVYVLDQNSNRISKFTDAGKFVWQSPSPAADPDLGNFLHGLAVRSDGTLIASCEQCPGFLVFDPSDGHVLAHIAATGTDGDHAGPMNLDAAGNIYVAVYGSSSELIFSPTGTYLGGDRHDPALPQTQINRQMSWGDTFWPSPVFLPDGRGFTFSKDGLTELKVTLSAN